MGFKWHLRDGSETIQSSLVDDCLQCSGLRVLSAWAETNREALKRIKGKQLCEENSVLGTVDEWRDLD